MIIIYHNSIKVVTVLDHKNSKNIISNQLTISKTLLNLSEKFPEEIIVWCHEKVKNELNIEAIQNLFHHNKMLFSYNPLVRDYFGKELGFIEDSPFIKINKKKRYPTWQVSSIVGAVHSSVLIKCKADIALDKNFDYFLNSFSKRAIVFGLFCYSEPNILKNKSISIQGKQSNIFEFFKFTKQHYKTRWIFILFLNLLIFEKRVELFPLIFSLFYKKRMFNPESLNQINIKSKKSVVEKATIDVLIPTIGRKNYLHDVLNNLTQQTHLPINVIIIEQNPLLNSISELDFITDQFWPFNIIHHFTNQIGACNARNIGLESIESEYCFFADDDIVFEKDLIEKVFHAIESTGNEVVLISCHLKSQIIKPEPPKQFPIFGAGHAFVKSICLKGLNFNMAYEFGFGEDGDFGMQLLNKGYDILLVTTTEIIHLKAPMGGFRIKPKLKWGNEKVQPKPSPTVMLSKLLHSTNEQFLLGKMLMFFKYYKIQSIKNPFKYYNQFQKQWKCSTFWANQLLQEYEV